MQTYLGMKVVEAEPMTKGEFEESHQREIQGTDFGPEAPGYVVQYPDGYRSWCPAESFEDANRPINGLTFGMAVELARHQGCKIARAGWNGKGMFVVHQKGYPEGIPANKNTAEAFGMKEGDLFKVRPYLQMRCADGTHQMWLASQSDILEDDWMIVE